jgi:alkylated DNA nucleotide flippase Atl1
VLRASQLLRVSFCGAVMVGEPRQVGATLQGLETEKVPFWFAINEHLQLH